MTYNSKYVSKVKFHTHKKLIERPFWGSFSINMLTLHWLTVNGDVAAVLSLSSILIPKSSHLSITEVTKTKHK